MLVGMLHPRHQYGKPIAVDRCCLCPIDDQFALFLLDRCSELVAYGWGSARLKSSFERKDDNLAHSGFQDVHNCASATVRI